MAKAKTGKRPVRNVGLGMRMHRIEIIDLVRLGLSAHPQVATVFQNKQQRWMLAGEEGGGSNGDTGHYVGFAGVAPAGIDVSIPVDSKIHNSIQRRVISQQAVRAQLYRCGNSCTILVTHHSLELAAEVADRPVVLIRKLFHHRNGLLVKGTNLPVFFDRSGESIDTPSELVPLIQAVCNGVTTQRNHRTHCISVPSITLPPPPKIRASEVADAAETGASAPVETTASPDRPKGTPGSRRKNEPQWSKLEKKAARRSKAPVEAEVIAAD
jgi:hypothetical protein